MYMFICIKQRTLSLVPLKNYIRYSLMFIMISNKLFFQILFKSFSYTKVQFNYTENIFHLMSIIEQKIVKRLRA